MPHLASTLQELTILEFKFFENSKLCTSIYDKNKKRR